VPLSMQSSRPHWVAAKSIALVVATVCFHVPVLRKGTYEDYVNYMVTAYRRLSAAPGKDNGGSTEEGHSLLAKSLPVMAIIASSLHAALLARPTSALILTVGFMHCKVGFVLLCRLS
jgi:hypothetical protein